MDTNLDMPLEQKIRSMIDRGALFVINHSGGKDSQAMFHVVRAIVPKNQLLVIHADLGDVEWAGVKDHIKDTIFDLPLIVCKNENKTLLEMVERRGMFPSPEQRQCTSDLKRGPIEREIRRYLKANPQYNNLVVNCMGLRAEESSSRAKQKAFKLSTGNSIAGREWYDWLPIHDMKIEQVWAVIEAAGQKRHWAYDQGMSRLSCCFCIMSSKGDLLTAAKNNPGLYRRYVELEKQIGRSMMMPEKGTVRFLEEVTGLTVEEAERLYEEAGTGAQIMRRREDMKQRLENQAAEQARYDAMSPDELLTAAALAWAKAFVKGQDQQFLAEDNGQLSFAPSL